MNPTSLDEEKGEAGGAAGAVIVADKLSATLTTKSSLGKLLTTQRLRNLTRIKASSGSKLSKPVPLWHRLLRCFKRPPKAEAARRETIIRQSEKERVQRIMCQTDSCLVHKSPRGYPKLAAFLDSDDNFMVFRRFGYLQSRLLLEKQDDLRILETQLDKLDRADARNDPESLMTREVLEDDDAKPQAELLGEIEKRFCEYCTLIIKAPAQKISDSGCSPSVDLSASFNLLEQAKFRRICQCGSVDQQREILLQC